MTRLFAALFLAIPLLVGALPGKLLRNDFRVESDPGVHLFVREVSAPSDGVTPSRSILLLHGAPMGGVASFDLPVAGGSLAADLVQ
jgi:hypothetical protein